MDERRIVAHFNGQTELLDVDHFDKTTVGDLLERVQYRFYGDLADVRANNTDCLCEGPYAIKPLDDSRLREIDQMLQQLTDSNYHNQQSGVEKRTFEVWLCNDTNNKFLFQKTSTTDQRHDSDFDVPVASSVISKDTYSQSLHSESSVSSTADLERDPFLAELCENQENGGDFDWNKFCEENPEWRDLLQKPSESYNTSNVETSDENRHKFKTDFCSEIKKQYKTDIFPLDKFSKAKKNKPNAPTTIPQATNKKRKINKKTKNYPSYLQAVKSKNQDPDEKYPRSELPQRYDKLIQEGRTVPAYVAVIKYIDGRRCLDAQKGFLVDKQIATTPLENPCRIELKRTDRHDLPPNYYEFKLILIQVAGDSKRKCTREFNERFDFSQRTVDESATSKYSNYNTTNNTDDPDEFRIVAVLSDTDFPLMANWSTFIDSNAIRYKTSKSVKKQKTSSTAAACSRGQNHLQATQENEEESDDDDDND